MAEPISLGVKLGVELLTKVAPEGLAWVKTKVFGVNVLTVGERRSGKSSFVNYFEYGVLLPDGTTTPRTLDNRDTASFILTMGRDKSLRMNVRRVTDTRGHDSVQEQVDLIARRKPTVLMIFLDASRNWANKDDDYGPEFLEAVLESFNSRCARASKISVRLKHVCIVMNKADKISKVDFDKKHERIKSVVSSFKSPHWGGTSADVCIYPCISVEHPKAVEHLDNVIKSTMLAVLLKTQ